MSGAQTLGDLRRGMCVHARRRDPACSPSYDLWEAVGLPDATPIEVLRERWTPLGACLLALADGCEDGPRVGAVAWVERGLGSGVLCGADLRDAYLGGADLRDADLGGADLRDADLRDARANHAPPGWTVVDGRLRRADEVPA